MSNPGHPPAQLAGLDGKIRYGHASSRLVAAWFPRWVERGPIVLQATLSEKLSARHGVTVDANPAAAVHLTGPQSA